MLFKLTSCNYNNGLKKPLLFSICNHLWMGSADTSRRIILHKFLVKNHIVNFPISHMIIETVYDKYDRISWDIQRLNAARTGYVSFLKMTVFSKVS